jgi:beta-lactamase superfamily II metal-dependent hydrolase
MVMKIEIHDVGHGHCTVITAPNGTRIMVDCGTRIRDDRAWWPSLHHFRDEIAMLALMNLDEDHIRDFGSVLKECPVRSVLTNPTIGPREFQTLKKQGMGPGAQAVLQWMSTPKAVVPPESVDWGGVLWNAFWNLYGGTCETTNDLSLALFIRYGAFTILFAGDLEAKGWKGMLANPDFVSLLAGVNIFVASHHGRENGCCDELFKLMKPELIIVSDDVMQHETQETNAWYRQRCLGAGLILDPAQRRYVMTTRDDGAMQIDVDAAGHWKLTPNILVADWPLTQSKASTALTAPFGFNALNDPLGFGGLGLINRR